MNFINLEKELTSIEYRNQFFLTFYCINAPPGRLRFRFTGLLSGGPHVSCLPSPRVSPMFRSRSAGLGDDAYTPTAYTGHAGHVWVHVVLNNISNCFFDEEITGLKISRLMVDFEDEKRVLISPFINSFNVNSKLWIVDSRLCIVNSKLSTL